LVVAKARAGKRPSFICARNQLEGNVLSKIKAMMDE